MTSGTTATDGMQTLKGNKEVKEGAALYESERADTVVLPFLCSSVNLTDTNIFTPGLNGPCVEST